MNKNIIPNKYDFLELLHESINSKIVKVKDKVSNETKVLKIVSPESPFYQGIFDEFRFIKENVHPNLVKIYNFGFLDNGYYYYEMPFYDKSDPEEYCKAEKVKAFLSIFWQTLNGLNFLHKRDKLHGDISMDNIFVVETEKGIDVKISDFGLSSLIVAQNISQIPS